MDVMGIAPTEQEGAEFCASLSAWVRLWSICCQVSPAARGVRHGYSNDGDGLDAEGARALAHDLRLAAADVQALAERQPAFSWLPTQVERFAEFSARSGGFAIW